MSALPTVLIVDDHKQILQLLGLAFKREGFYVHTASDIAEAKIYLERETPDLAVIDLYFDGDPLGYELVNLLRERLAKVDIVLMSGSATLRIAAEAVDSGVLCVVGRPVTAREILDEVARMNRVRPPPETLATIQIRHIQAAIAYTEGNVSKAARQLGLTRGGLSKKLKKSRSFDGR